jgi:hypothetical protein
VTRDPQTRRDAVARVGTNASRHQVAAFNLPVERSCPGALGPSLAARLPRSEAAGSAMSGRKEWFGTSVAGDVEAAGGRTCVGSFQ